MQRGAQHLQRNAARGFPASGEMLQFTLLPASGDPEFEVKTNNRLFDLPFERAAASNNHAVRRSLRGEDGGFRDLKHLGRRFNWGEGSFQNVSTDP